MTFTLADNKTIGQYLAKRIDGDGRFKSRRHFCEQYVKLMAGKPTNAEADETQVKNMENRLSQILNGGKGIQLYDLPLLCMIFDVSCEELLSAGKNCAPTSAHLTNYVAAFSKDEREWEEYISRENSPILNADEYGKTVIDYALEAKNYDFLRYLVEQKLIWFVGPDEKDYFLGFGAGTSIERANFPYPRNLNILDIRLKERDSLRMQMITLAVENHDMKMLGELHAREIPALYRARCGGVRENETYNSGELLEALAHAGNDVLEYFSEEFEITDSIGKKHSYLFPFIGELIERLLREKNSFAEFMLKDAVQHNQSVYDQLDSLLSETVQAYKKIGIDIGNKKDQLTKQSSSDLNFYQYGLVEYYDLMIRKGMMSNLVRVNVDPADIDQADPVVKRRIKELNELYDAVHDLAE